MAKSFNQAIIMGNLTRDPELRTTPGGQQVASFVTDAKTICRWRFYLSHWRYWCRHWRCVNGIFGHLTKVSPPFAYGDL